MNDLLSLHHRCLCYDSLIWNLRPRAALCLPVYKSANKMNEINQKNGAGSLQRWCMLYDSDGSWSIWEWIHSITTLLRNDVQICLQFRLSFNRPQWIMCGLDGEHSPRHHIPPPSIVDAKQKGWKASVMPRLRSNTHSAVTPNIDCMLSGFFFLGRMTFIMFKVILSLQFLFAVFCPIHAVIT